MQELLLDTIDSPIGEILMVIDGDRMCALYFADRSQRMTMLLAKRYKQFQLSRASNPCGYSDLIRRYFAGDYRSLDAIEVNTGGTAFQQQVWSALRAIPPGQTTTYGRLAIQLERPNAFRAVGAANALNPISIVIPCHRLIGSDASLTGYAGGLERKRWLLKHEGSDL